MIARAPKRAAGAPPPDTDLHEQNTRARILRAAMDEFAANGSSGARVEKIAKAADVNIRMIYYFFGSKKALLDEVLSEIFQDRLARAPAGFDSLNQLLVGYFDGYASDPDRVRLLLWEALELDLPEGAGQLTNLAERQRVIKKRVAVISDLQKSGQIPADLDPKMLYLAFVALSMFPMTFPQSVYVALGADAASPAFKRKYRKFLGQLADSWAGKARK
jgi:TetR/AcrR family transcriptional regulator